MEVEGWRLAPVRELGQVQAGRQRSPHAVGSPRRYLRVANVFDGYIDTSDVLQMNFTDDEFGRYKLRDGDVLLNEGQSLELVGRAAMYRGSPPSCAFQNTLVRFRAHEGTVAAFALHLFQHLQKSGAFAEIATQTTSIAHLGVTRFAELRVRVPPQPEQQKITAILSSVDDVIEKTEAVIAQLQVVKKAMMQELLTRGLPGRHTRFKMTEIGEVPETWGQAALGLLLASGPDNGLYKPQSEYGEGSPIVRIDGFQNGEKTSDAGLRRVRVSTEERARFGLRPRDLLVNRVNSITHIGKSTMVTSLSEPTVFESNMMRLAVDQNRLLPEFAFVVLSSERARLHFVENAKRAIAQASINQQDVKALPVQLPSLEEQQAIVSTLDVVSSRLEMETSTLTAQTELKSALASALLTGEVRVNVDQEVAA